MNIQLIDGEKTQDKMNIFLEEKMTSLFAAFQEDHLIKRYFFNKVRW